MHVCVCVFVVCVCVCVCVSVCECVCVRMCVGMHVSVRVRLYLTSALCWPVTGITNHEEYSLVRDLPEDEKEKMMTLKRDKPLPRTRRNWRR